ncbi:hypothetical protein BLA29_011470 [Euroglyphus maynei]|uniref:Uncharacterized protein n=1 Tax=Euroglyphus maynei TaxID=6958 RepID=A0A1Y3B7A2_EURMA|nr:hypothetical protein BLA29_011470 [Euroglyphus maynei]
MQLVMSIRIKEKFPYIPNRLPMMTLIRNYVIN